METYTWEDYTLTLEYAGIGQWGKTRVAYRLSKAGESAPIFQGADLEGHFDAESPEAAAALLDFLTLREGDTDDEYFEGYTDRQWEFSECEAEDLRWWGWSLRCPECGTVCPDENDFDKRDEDGHCEWCGTRE